MVWLRGTFMLIALPLHYLHFTKCWSAHSLSMAVVWDPTSPTLTSSIESTQHHIVAKSWSTDYSSLPSQFCLSTLEHRRKKAKVTVIFKSKLNLLHLPNSPLRSPPPPPYSLRHYDPHNYLPIICKTHSFSTSFYPTAVKLWNSLPSLIKSLVTPLLFKFMQGEDNHTLITCTTNSKPTYINKY